MANPWEDMTISISEWGDTRSKRPRTDAGPGCGGGHVGLRGFQTRLFRQKIPLEFGACLLMVPLCTLIQAIPISFNGWGLREGVYVVYFSQVGLPRESALAFSIVAAGMVVILSISGLFVWLGRRSHAHDAPKEDA